MILNIYKHMNPLKPSLKTEWFPVLLIIIGLGMGLYTFLYGPDRMPMHWDIAGNVNGWSSRTFAAIFMPALMIGIYALFLALPRLDPRGDQYAIFAKAYVGIKNIFMIFFLLIYVLTIAAGFGYSINIGMYIPVAVGLLFIGLGYYMGTIKQNFMMGVRNPWTLSNAEIWDKTNRLMGPVMAIAGVLIAAAAFIPQPLFKIISFVVAIAGIIIVPNLYSYLLFKKTKV